MSSVEVVGARRLRRTLRDADGDLADMQRVHHAVASIVAAAAAAGAPRRTGTLASTVRPGKAASRAVVRAGFKRVPYAGPIHWGWPARNITAQPFLVDAAHTTEPRWITKYQSEVNRILQRVEGA